MASLLDIAGFTGINALPDRRRSELASGKNIVFENNFIKTRGGSSLLDKTFDSPVKSIHAAARQSVSRLLIEEGSTLWHRTTASGNFTQLKTGLTGYGVNSCRWQDYLILVDGVGAWAYSLENHSIADLGGNPPAMSNVMEWNNRIFGWNPYGNRPFAVNFCGIDQSTLLVSKDIWDTALYTIDVGHQNTINPVFAFTRFLTHFFVLFPNGFCRVYGSNAEDFQPTQYGVTNIINDKCWANCNSFVAWVGKEIGQYRVFAYRGPSPIRVSAPVEEFFEGLNFSNAWAICFEGAYHLFIPDDSTDTTLLFVYDGASWQVHEYPAVITCAANYYEYMETGNLYMGLKSKKVAICDDSMTNGKPTDWGTPITSEFILETRAGGQLVNFENIYVNANPVSNFTINATAKVEGKPWKTPVGYTFIPDGEIADMDIAMKFSNLWGRNLKLKFTSTDKIDRIQGMSIITNIQKEAR